MTICKFCKDKGCIVCPQQTEPEPQGMPEPIFTARLDNEHDMKLLRDYFGREALESGQVAGLYPSIPFADIGQEIETRGALATLLQYLHNEREGAE